MYHPGQTISGTFQVVLKEPKSYKYIEVKLKRKQKVSWTEERTTGTGEDRHTETVEYDEKEKVVESEVVVWGNKDASEPTDMEPGTHNLPFQISIDSNSPPTFDTTWGQIKYRLVGEISKSGKDHKVKTPVIIGILVDFNSQPNLSLPVEKSVTKDITTCCCFSAGETEINLSIPRIGFCAAKERIPVTVECKNGSSKVVTVRVELVQKITYKADGHVKRDHTKIDDFTNEIQASESDTKSSEINVPSSIKLGFSSRFITVAHFVQLWVEHSWNLSGIFEDPPISVPVVIGNKVLNEGEYPSSGNNQASAAYPPLQVPGSGPAYPPQADAQV